MIHAAQIEQLQHDRAKAIKARRKRKHIDKQIIRLVARRIDEQLRRSSETYHAAIERNYLKSAVQCLGVD